MKTEINKDLLHQAINQWGVKAQIEMIIEECLELAVALQKLKRNKGLIEEKTAAVIDEIADVRIIIEQAMIIFSDPDNQIQKRIDFKMNRLSERLNEKNELFKID
jgi:NTP pyrophosphatase (non-canonical NTP hydrolase)